MSRKCHYGREECFEYLGRKSTNAAKCKLEIKSGTVIAKAAFNKKKKKTLFTSKLD
jgi:hypothetical protein